MESHAIEVRLTRPATGTELAAARRAADFPLAASVERTRLLAVTYAGGRRKAIGRVWDAVGDLLPVDVITTALANRKGEVLLSVRFDDPVAERFRRAAADCGMSTEAYVREAVLRGLSRDEAARAARLDAEVTGLLAAATPAELAASALRGIARTGPQQGPGSHAH